MIVKKRFEILGLSLAALFGLQAQRGVSALAAPGGLDGVTGIAAETDLLVQQPIVSFLETCHLTPPALK
jgi:hypothetical protein